MQFLIWQMLSLNFFSDADMYLFFEEGMRDWVSYSFKKYSKANNKYLKSFDPKQESKHIIYLHANNLCSYTMYKFVSTSWFKWMDSKNFDSNKYNSNSSNGFFLEVDLEYPKELPKLDNNYPMAPNKIEIKIAFLSSSQLKIADFYNIFI